MEGDSSRGGMSVVGRGGVDAERSVWRRQTTTTRGTRGGQTMSPLARDAQPGGELCGATLSSELEGEGEGFVGVSLAGPGDIN